MLVAWIAQAHVAVPLAERWKLEAPQVVVAGEREHFSGLAWTAKGTLLAVDDHGKLLEYSVRGEKLRELDLAGRPDLEDVCVDDRGESAWLAVEDTCELIRVDLGGWREVERVRAPSSVPRGAKGVEALCFANAPGGTRELWLGHQGAKQVFALEAPPAEVGVPGRELALHRTLELGAQIRAIAFDAANAAWLCADEDAHQLVLVSSAGERLDALAFAMPPNTVEGLAIDRDGALYACADGGPIVRFEPRAPSSDAHSAKLAHLATLDVPSFAPEIAAVSADHTLLGYVDALWRTLEIGQLDLGGKTPAWKPFDLARSGAGPRGVQFATTPTSVAAHPSLPIAFVTTVGAHTEERGLVRAIDLRRASLGRELWAQPVGRHPDSIAVSRDGRWLIVANEGEGDDRAAVAPGTVSVLDTTGVDLLAPRDARSVLEHRELDVWQGIAPDAGQVEPEYVVIDPQSRFAVVTCQENDAAVIVDLRGAAPAVTAVKLVLPRGSQPDGAAVLDGYVDAKLGRGALIALAEEGEFDESGKWLGQCVSFHWLGPEPSFARAELLGRVDLAELLHSRNHRACPESVVLTRRGDRVLALVAAERADTVAMFDATDARAARSLGIAPTGKRPEGMLLFEHDGRALVVTADEGNEGPGELTFLEITDPR